MSYLQSLIVIPFFAAACGEPSAAANSTARVAARAALPAVRDALEDAPVGARRSVTDAAQRAAIDRPITGGLQPLFIVLGVIGGVAWIARRMMPRRAGGGGAGGGIRVLSRQALGGKQSVALIRLGRHLVLVGLTPQRMDALLHLDDADEVAQVCGALEAGAEGSVTQRFRSLLTTEARQFENDEPDLGRKEPAGRMAAAGTAVRDLAARLRGAGTRPAA